MAQKVLTWSNSQLNNSLCKFHVPCLRSPDYVPCLLLVLYMYSVKIHFRCERCGICVDLYMIYNYMLRIALWKTHKSILLRETFFARLGGGGGLHKNVSQILAIIDFFKQRNYRKNLVSKEGYYRQHNFKPSKSFKLRQVWRRQPHSLLPIGTIRMN